MRLLTVQQCCPKELEQAVERCSSLGECLEVVRPLAYHQDCLVSLQLFKPLGLQVAVKSYSKHRLSKLAREQVDTEAHIHACLDHEHVVPLLLSAEDDRCLHLVVQWADGGDLRQHIAGIGEQRLKEFVVRPLLHALAVLDAKGVVHRDVKPDNVLVHQGQVQLADFGLAVYCHLRDEPAPACSSDEELHSQEPLPTRNAEGDEEVTPSCASVMMSAHSSLSLTALSARSSCSMLDSGSALPHQPPIINTATAPMQALEHHHSVPPPLSAVPGVARSASAQPLSSATIHATRRPGSASPSSASFVSSAELMSSASGTPLYTAPEVIRCMFESRPVDLVVTPKNDVWSLGILVLEALSGSHPFSRCGNTLHAIATHRSFTSLPAHLSPAATSWLHAALDPDPTFRLSAAQLLAHPWLQPAPCTAAVPMETKEQQGGVSTAQEGPAAAAVDRPLARLQTRLCGGDPVPAGMSPRGHSAGGLVLVHQGCKAQLHREAGGSIGGASPAAGAGNPFLHPSETWEF